MPSRFRCLRCRQLLDVIAPKRKTTFRLMRLGAPMQVGLCLLGALLVRAKQVLGAQRVLPFCMLCGVKLPSLLRVFLFLASHTGRFLRQNNRWDKRRETKAPRKTQTKNKAPTQRHEFRHDLLVERALERVSLTLEPRLVPAQHQLEHLGGGGRENKRMRGREEREPARQQAFI